jgi:hypothetical protein
MSDKGQKVAIITGGSQGWFKQGLAKIGTLVGIFEPARAALNFAFDKIEGAPPAALPVPDGVK